jgi:hypothetical protein
MRESNLLLSRLDAFTGTWEVEASVHGRAMGRGRATFEWREEGAYLFQRAEAGPPLPPTPADWPEGAPTREQWQEYSPLPVTMFIGLDDTAERFTVLYADAREVFRVYQMSVDDGVWRLWREAPGFHQRFTGRFGAGGRTITGAWEGSPDGTDWAYDFDQTYTR